jgi:hypothetical protein
MHVHEWVEFWKNKSKKLEDNSNPKIVTHNATQLQLAVTSVSEIKIQSFTHRYKDYKIL